MRNALNPQTVPTLVGATRGKVAMTKVSEFNTQQISFPFPTRFQDVTPKDAWVRLGVKLIAFAIICGGAWSEIDKRTEWNKWAGPMAFFVPLVPSGLPVDNFDVGHVTEVVSCVWPEAARQTSVLKHTPRTL